MPDPSPRLTIAEVAERTGKSVHALRFYESEGLLVSPVRRGPGGRRIYSEQDVEWLMICIRLRASGMPLTEIRAYTALVRHGVGNEKERLAILQRHRERVADQIRELSECLDLINYKVRVYEHSLAEGTAGQLWSV